jgi:hypothetical protein
MSSPSTEAMKTERSERIDGDSSEQESVTSSSKMRGGAAPRNGATDSIGTRSQQTKERSGYGFSMKLHGVSTQRKRKRELTGSPSTPLCGSSSSSSDEEEQEMKLGSRDAGTDVTASSPTQGKESLQQGTPVNGVASSVSPSEQGTGNKDREAHGSQTQTPNEGWRVKLYRLNADGSWDDCGTGSILCLYKKTGHKASAAGQSSPSGDAWVYHELGEPTLCMHSEVKNASTGATITIPKILLRTRILLRDAYQRQGDNIITWCEPYLEEGSPTQGVDLALSFQDISGCLDIWRQITQVQSKAVELFRQNGGESSNGDGSRSRLSEGRIGDHLGDTNEGDGPHPDHAMAYAASAAHDLSLQRQQQQEMWANAVSEATQHHLDHQKIRADRNRDHHFEDASMVASFHEISSGPQSISSNTPQCPQLPNPPGLANLEEIADAIAAVQVCHTCCSLFYTHVY